jgi:hypothetical protein
MKKYVSPIIHNYGKLSALILQLPLKSHGPRDATIGRQKSG